MDESGRKDYRSLGEILRDARVSQGKSIQDLSEITKIVPKNIIALEADDLDRLAGPVYARGFTRTLAEALKLDVEFLLTKLSNASPASAPPEPIHVEPMPRSTRIVSDAVTPLGAEKQPPRDETTWHIQKVRVTRVESPKKKWNPMYLVAAAALVAASIALYVVAGRGSGVTTEPPANVNASGEQMATLGGAGQDPMQSLDAATQPETSGSEVDVKQPAARTEQAKPANRGRDADETEELVPPQETRQSTGGQRELAGPAEEPVVEQPTPAAPKPAPAESAATKPQASVDSKAAEEEARVQAPAEEEVTDERAGGLGSIVRPDADNPVKPLRTLRLSSMEEVEIWAAADGEELQRHILRRGGSLTLEGRDHFSLKLDDPSSVIVVLDGIRRDPPPGHSGEWIIWADESQR